MTNQQTFKRVKQLMYWRADRRRGEHYVPTWIDREIERYTLRLTEAGFGGLLRMAMRRIED